MGMILLINVCKEKLHYYEFVRPIEDILRGANIEFFIKYYKNLTNDDLGRADKIIICGTALKDFEYEQNLTFFSWINNFYKPLLGICAGMQIIGLMHGGKMKTKGEIGFYFEEFKRGFLGLKGKQEVWHLHHHFIDFKKLKDFEIYSECNGVSQAVKHKNKEIYGVLFHPEVRQKEIVSSFILK